MAAHREKRKNVILLIILTLHEISATALSDMLFNAQRESEAERDVWLRLLLQMDREQAFDLVLVVGHTDGDFLEELLEMEMEKSVLINENFTQHYDLDVMHSNFVTLVIMPDMEVTELVAAVAEKLDFRRSNRVIFINNQMEDGQELQNVMEIFKECEQHKLVNSLMILSNFLQTQILYSFRIFPEFALETRVFNESFAMTLFPSKVNNMYGQVLRTIPDQVMPRSVVYRDNEGQIQITGYIIHFIRMFAKYVNATLKFPHDLEPGQTLFYRDFVNWTQLDLLDIPCSITPVVNDNTSRLMSYTHEILNWCLMLPVEQPLTYQDFLKGFLTLTFVLFVLMMDIIFTSLLTLSMRLINMKQNRYSGLHLVDVLVNPQFILGHLGSSFKLHDNPILSLRIIYVSLFLSGLLYTTAFSVQLNAFLTRPSTQDISTLDDMLEKKIYILTASKEFKALLTLSGTYFLPYLSLFKVIDSYKDFADIRSSFNSSYAYPVTSSVWHVYNAQQKLFSKQLFRRTNICFTHLDVMAFVLPRNSLHKLNLDTLITRVRDMGFVTYWLQNSYYNLVKSGGMSFKDLSHSADPVSYIKMQDFYYVILNLFKSFSLSFLIFLLELAWFYRYLIFRGGGRCCRS